MDSSSNAPLETTVNGGTAGHAVASAAGVRELIGAMASLPTDAVTIDVVNQLQALTDQLRTMLPGDAPVRAADPSTDILSATRAVPACSARIDSVRDLIDAMASLPMSRGGPGQIDELRDLEDLKSAAAGRQSRVTVSFDLGERHSHALAGIPAAERGKGVAAQVALARRESPYRGGMLLGMAEALVTEMPHTLAALETGQLNEWRATLLVKETACLSAADRCAVDEDLSPDTGAFDGAGNRQITAAAKTAAYRRDPRSVTERAGHAARNRYVSLRPAPDTMTYLTALLPVTEGVAVHAELTRHADSLRANGDERTRGQLMADTLVERTTGTPGGISRVEVQLIMTDRTLFQGDSEPARVPGYGVVPAGWARSILTTPGKQAPEQLTEPGKRTAGRPTGAGGRAFGTPAGTQAGPAGEPAQGPGPASGRPKDPREEFEVWLRRLYTAPATGELVAADSKARLFTLGQRRFLQARDDLCRTPYCDAPIRHYDHIVPWRDNGPTSLPNGAGLCEACNHTKELAGWKSTAPPGPESHLERHCATRPDPMGRPARHTLELRTPTGHTYRSTAPPLPGSHQENRERQATRSVRPSGSTAGARDHRGDRTYEYTRYSRRVDLVFA